MDTFKISNNVQNCEDGICTERNCSNCAKARITGYNYQNAPLYTCKPVKGEPELITHVSYSDCKHHESFEEKYGASFRGALLK